MSAQTALAVLSGSSSRAELAAVVGRGVGDREAADQAVPAVDAEVVLVAEHRDQRSRPVAALRARSPAAERLRPRLIVQRPSRVHLGALGLRPGRGHRAGLDRRLLVRGEPRPARLDHGRIHDLPAHREVAGGAQRGIEPLEQPLDRARLGQLLAVQPDRLGVRHRSSSASPRKRMNESRSRIWYSVWSSDSVYSVCSTRTLNISTAS